MVTKNNLAFRVVPDVSLLSRQSLRQKCFSPKGFDAVSVAEVTDYLGINPRASTRLLAVRLGYLAVYSMNMSVRKLFRLPIFFVMIVR